MKSGSARLLLARGFLAGRLPSGAFPASCFPASSFALGLGSWPVAFVALAGLDLGFRTLPPIHGQRPADIVRFIELAALVAADKALVPASIDQFSLAGHQVHSPAVHGFPIIIGDGEVRPPPSPGASPIWGKGTVLALRCNGTVSNRFRIAVLHALRHFGAIHAVAPCLLFRADLGAVWIHLSGSALVGASASKQG